jgi:3'-5' exoribonuclease
MADTRGARGKVFIDEIRDGDRVRSVFLVRFKATPVKRNGEPYINLNLVDRTGEIEAKIWDNARELDKRFQKNDFIAVEGTANLYQGKLQLRVDDARRVDESQVSIADFLPVSQFDADAMWGEVRALLGAVKNPDLKRLLDSITADPGFSAAFRRAPAAKEIHHAYIGGLLEHSLSMMRAAERLCPLYPLADRDLTVAGCFLHDIGKVRELFYEKAFDYTDEGRLVGHIAGGVEMLDGLIDAAGGVPEPLSIHLKHIILSHHGELEFGSPKRPKTVEALLVSMLDDLDARMNSWRQIFDREPGEGWTSFQKMYDRYLFKGRPYRQETAGREQGEATAPKQPAAERKAPVPAEKAGKSGGMEDDLKFKPFSQIPLISDLEGREKK